MYVREAHPTDGQQAAPNIRDGVLLSSAKTDEEKDSHATACVRKLNIEFRALVDGMDNAVELAYSAWPDRLYLVSKQGRIVFKGAPGPAGFRPAELQAAIMRELAN